MYLCRLCMSVCKVAHLVSSGSHSLHGSVHWRVWNGCCTERWPPLACQCQCQNQNKSHHVNLAQAAGPSAERRQAPGLPNERIVEAPHVRVPDEGHTTHALMQERRCDRGRWSMPQSPCSGSPRPGPLVAVPLGVRKRGLAVTRHHARSGPVQRLVERCRCQ